ncbi:MAG: 5-(carboxyamino)imidazole ribonucleotide synthase [Leptolyngbyaceae cyanobacterium]
MTQQRVGIIGGGQLAWMMGLEAPHLDIDIIVQTPQPSDPAVTAARETILAPVDDAGGTRALSDRCQVITFENEFVNLATLAPLEADGVTFRPRLTALEPLLDKYVQRQFLAAHNLPNPPYVALDTTTTEAAARALAEDIGWPLMMKTRRLGYDGQGTCKVSAPSELLTTWAQLERSPVLLEAFIPFAKELAVMVARSAQGEIAVYPVVETQQIDQVCRHVIAPAAIPESVEQRVTVIAQTLVTALDFVGILGIELFLLPDSTVVVNEVAPRTHNSGHYTLDACITSQFAQQLLAVTGRTLGSTGMTCHRAVMINLLGFETATSDYPDVRSRLAEHPRTHVHWYDKQQSYPGRKLGHVTVCLTPTENVATVIQTIESLWYPSES